MIRRLVTLALASVTTLALAGAKGCEESGQHPSFPQPAPPPTTKGRQSGAPSAPSPAAGDPKPHKKKRVVFLSVFVEPEFGPYEVVFSTSSGVHETHPVAGGQWNQTFVYESGQSINISLEVKPARAGSKRGYCSIDDGGLTDHRTIDGGWRAMCHLVTGR